MVLENTVGILESPGIMEFILGKTVGTLYIGVSEFHIEWSNHCHAVYWSVVFSIKSYVWVCIGV